jgi:hypothetical protein
VVGRGGTRVGVKAEKEEGEKEEEELEHYGGVSV